MYKLIRPLLFQLPAETAHHVTLASLGLADRVGLLSVLKLSLFRLSWFRLNPKPVTLMGIAFPNRVGLAAGLDKNGEFINALGRLGFGFVEIGTVTPRPQPGNPKPRLFRVADADGIINRMGFNNEGVDYLVDQVKKSNYSGVLGINIGKNFDTLVENAISDYVLCMRKVYIHADYITINISSPNTPGLRTLQYGEDLDDLLNALKKEQQILTEKHSQYTPMLVKVAPDLTSEEVESIASVLIDNKIDGLIATNTTVSRDSVECLANAKEQGGLSGKPLTEKSTEIIAAFYKHLQGQIPIIGVGGISSGQDAKDKIEAGAELIQIYSGLVYQGTGLIKKVVLATESDSE